MMGLNQGNRTANQNKFYDVAKMTPVEERIYELHLQGKSRAEIGVELNMKPNSVSRRLATIREKAVLQ